MSKCDINAQSLKLIRSKVVATLMMSRAKKETIDTLKDNMVKLLNKIAEDYNLAGITEITSAVYTIAQQFGVVDQSSDFFSVENLTNLLTGADQGILRNNTLGTSADRLTDTELVRIRLEANKEFLNNAYGLAKEVLNAVVSQTNQNIFDCCFINRGSVNPNDLRIVKNNSELNDNIRQYQEVLFLRMVNYFNSLIDESPNIENALQKKEILQNATLYKDVNGTLEYTGILENATFRGLVNSYLSASVLTSDILTGLYNTANDPTKGTFEKERDKRRLDAYNANVILTHFDSYLSVTLGKAIEIKDFNVKTGENKYQIAGKTSNLATTWRTSENIDVESEADAITKMAINTTPLYRWQQQGPISGRYLHFSDFEHIIAKIKDLSYREDVMRIVFDDKFIAEHEALWDSLSDGTKQFLRGKTLSQAINFIRRNPRQYISSIFELLTNEEFAAIGKETFLGKQVFTDDELDKMYTLTKKVFDPTSESSLYTLAGQDFETDYYSFITLTADSIFKVNYIQYYRDLDGITLVRTLIDLSVNNIRRGIEQTINTSNSINLIRNYQDYCNSLRLEPNDKNDFKYITYTLPISGANIKVKVVASSGSVTFVDTDTNKTISYFQPLWENESVRQYIDKVLHIGISNVDFQNALRNELSSYSEMCKNLLSFAARVHLNQYVSHEILNNLSVQKRERKLKEIYGKNSPKYNYQLDELGLIHGSDIVTLKALAIAKANITGVTTASLVKDGEGNGQSMQTLSRLLGSLQSQFDLQERQPWSATKEAILLTVPGLYEGVFTSKEFHSQVGDNKASTDMSVSEMSYTGIVQDFIGGLIQKEDNSVVGNGHVLLLPSVNSDKGTIGRIKINLNKEVMINGQLKPLFDSKTGKINVTNAELEALIAEEFGKIYTRMYTAITTDWAKLDEFIASKGIDAPSLAQDYLHGFAKFNLWWSNNRQYGESPAEFIKSLTLEYNKLNRLDPLELVDLVHYKNNKGNLGINLAFISQIARFNPQFLLKLDPNFNVNAYPSAATFWTTKKAEMLKGLLKSKFRVNTTATTLEELKYLRENYSNWINASGDMILAKAVINGRNINITSNRDLASLQEELKIDNTNDLINALSTQYSLQLNPILEQYNYLDYLFTQEFMCATVGSFIAHPEKSRSSDVLQQEAAHFLALHKRNVSFTAAMHAFQLNLLNGIPEEYNIAVISDITDELGTILGLNNEIKPFDGATFVNPFVVILENNSLGGARAGITKKQFVHFKNERTGTGGIIKTAGFGLTNDWIRNSPFLERMMRKMTNHVWLNQDGTPAIVDITKDYKGNKIKFKDFYFKQGTDIFKIEAIQSLGNNTYLRVLRKVDADGTPLSAFITESPVVINTNYQLWNFFGGKMSMTMGDRYLKLSNTSVENVVEAMNNIGTVIGNPAKVETQDLLWQPLKRVDVHYVPTAGAVKQGAANINSADKYHNDEDYDIQKIKMYLSGIQLDKEHHADGSELSLMTQVMSACAAKGYTFETAAGLYGALRKSTEIGTKDHLDAVRELFTTGSNVNLQEVMMKSIINALSTSNSENFAQILASDLIRLAREGKQIKFADAMLPLSDNTVYAKVFSIVSSYLTNSGIKQKIPGILSVLTPSHNIFKVYSDGNGGSRKYESFVDPTTELAAIQQLAELTPVFDVNNPATAISDLELGRTYKVTKQVPIKLDFTLEVNGVSLESAYRKIIYNRIKRFASPTVKGLITKIVNGNYNSSLGDIINRIVANVPTETQQEVREGLVKIVNLPISTDRSIEVNNEMFSERDYLKRILGSMTSIEMLSALTTNSRNTIYKALSRYGLLDLTDATIEGAKNYILRNNITLPVDTITESILIRTPTEYAKLKQDIKAGLVTRVVEDVTVGRDLAAYNVRFNTTDGRFQLWDLDSVVALYGLTAIDEFDGKPESRQNLSHLYNIDIVDTSDEAKDLAKIALINKFFGVTLKSGSQASTYVKRILLRDLMVLSNSTPALDKQYKKLLDSRENTLAWYNKYALWINIYLGTGLGSEIILNGLRTRVNAANFNEVEAQMRLKLTETTKVRINGQLLDVDKSSIKILAYEIIMPKTFATNFGLKEFDDLNTIKNDKDFFIKLYLRNQATKVNENLYAVELKVSNGNHYYLLTPKLVINSGLTKVNNIFTIVIDGKTYRIDSNGNTMYELTEGTEIYKDNQGHEVIVTEDLNAYIDSLHFDSIKLSSVLRTRSSIVDTLVKGFKKSKKKLVRLFKDYITAYGNGVNNILALNNQYHSLTVDNYTQAFPTNPIIRAGRAKHTSFLKSLDIVAARIPAQSMQSFMPMKVVAYDNPDINTAYVSTMQILLQGSDFDVDAVSLATFDINRNGMLQVWSPYANIESSELMEASMKLPFPSGSEVTFNVVDSLVDAGKFIQKYTPIFRISRARNFNKETKDYDISDSEVFIDLVLDTPESLALFALFILEVPSLNIPSSAFYESFATGLSRAGLVDNLTANHIPSLFEKIKEIADNHNMYFDNLTLYNLSKVVNNYTMYSMYRTIEDPVNLIQALTSVDGTTGPLKKEANKSSEAKEASTRTPGNVVNKFESIIENLVGKKGIAICATGLKAFFGLTQYYNYLLNYGTAEEQERILLGSEHRGVMIGGKVYRTLANIRSMDPNTITNLTVMEALASANNDHDAALILSALLSLATDNAKELALSKLNASTKTLGLYVYGISIGMDFKDIANIMMSDVGRVINEVLSDDVFSGKDGYGNVGETLFKYFDEGPKRLLNNFRVTRDSAGDTIASPTDILQKLFELKFKFKDDNGKPLPFAKALAAFSRSNLHLAEKLKVFDDLRGSYSNPSQEGKELFNQLIDAVEDYIQQNHIIGLNEGIYEDIKTLAAGAAEMKILGQLFGLNKGLKTSPDELASQINNIERAIYNHTEKLEDLIDLYKFAFDEAYRQECVAKYEEVKHSFNILDAIARVPNFMGYAQVLAVAAKEAQNAFKFRSSRALSLQIAKEIGYKKEDRIIKGVLNYIGDYLRKGWMRSRELAFVIPKGNKAFDQNGNEFDLTEDTPIKLGTDWGDATFRMWMENEVIPKLKNGELRPGANFVGISNNKFIRDLGNDLLTTTVSHNPTIIYTLPINMLPRIDQERAIFNGYKSEFNKLASYSYEYDTYEYNNEGVQSKSPKAISVVDLFTIYAMIADSWKLGEKSLVPILEDFQNSGLISDFHAYEMTIDKSGYTLTLENLDFGDILPYVAPFESPYSSFSKYIQYRNPSTRKYLIMRRLSRNEESSRGIENEYGDMMDSNRINEYEFQDGNTDSNYFPTGRVETPTIKRTLSFDYEGKRLTYSIIYDKESGQIKNLTIDGTAFTLLDFPGFDLIPTKKENGEKKIDLVTLESIIKNKLNPC